MAYQEIFPGYDVTNIVLVGSSGNGKSSTGNTLLSTNTRLNTDFFFRTKTRKCEMYRTAIHNGPIINVIDTPSIQGRSYEEPDFGGVTASDSLIKEIINCLTMVREGIHAVLFVLSTRRITPEDESAFNALQRIFEGKILDYVIVVFTRGDELEEDGQTLEDFLEGSGQPEFLTRILRRCGNRKVLFDNKTRDEDKKANQLQQLLAHVADVESQTCGVPYLYTVRPRLTIEELNDKFIKQERGIKAKNLAAIAAMKEMLQTQQEKTVDKMTMTHIVESTLKESAESHKKDLDQLKNTLQLKDAQTVNMMAEMVENALRQSRTSLEREMCQLKDTQTINMVAHNMSAAAHEREICQLKETLQLKDAQTMNMIEKMIENALKESATAHQREMRELKEILQQDQHPVLPPRKSKICECNIM